MLGAMRTFKAFTLVITAMVVTACGAEAPAEPVAAEATTTTPKLAPRLTTAHPTTTSREVSSYPRRTMGEPVAISECEVDAIRKLDRPNGERGEFYNVDAEERTWGWAITMDLDFMGTTHPVDCMINTTGARSVTTTIVGGL